MGLLEDIIQKDFGVTLGYYFLINYSAVRDTVNAVGGVTVNIKSPDQRGLYDPNIAPADGGPLKLANGPQHLNGQTALNLSRARGEPTADGRVGYGFPQSDFNRTEHQRQIFIALQSKVFSSSILFNPWRLGEVLDAFGNNVRSNMQINEARRFSQIMHTIPSSDLKLVSLRDNTTNLVQSYGAPNGQSALIPTSGLDDYSLIQAYLRRLGL
jgi:LCP family protein required for cell wall assembly